MLDTNAYSAFKRGDRTILDTLGTASEILVPLPVLARPSVRVPAMAEQTTIFYSLIFSTLKKKRTLIPVNDVWIAACAMESGSVLLTFDAHFGEVEGLVIQPD